MTDATPMLMPVIAIHWLLAAVFAEALHHKLDSTTRFAASFGAYRLLPENLVPVAARLIITLEAVTVLSCLFVQPAGLVLATTLLVFYAAGMGINRWRGRSFIDCGCGDEPVPISAALILRNLVLALLATGALLVPAQASAPWGELLAQGAAAGAAMGLYRCVNQLIGNAARFRLAGVGPA